MKSDKIPLFNYENLEKQLILKSRPLLYQELFIKTCVCISTEWQISKWERTSLYKAIFMAKTDILLTLCTLTDIY